MEAEKHKLRCGDVVRQRGADYNLVLAYADYEYGRASWMGWPEGTVAIEELTLVEPCSDADHEAEVARWLERPRSSEADHRRAEIERLYRPVAYWTRVVDRYQKEADQAQAALNSAVMMLREAEQAVRAARGKA